MSTSDPEFAATARGVSPGRVPLWRSNGGASVAIRGGRLTITGRKGNVLAETELENVRARALKRDAGASMRIWLPEKTYIVEWSAGTAVEIGGWLAAGPLGEGLGILSGVPKKRAITRAFLCALAEGGGDAGKE